MRIGNQQLTLTSLSKFLEPAEARLLRVLVGLRIVANFLDLLGLAGIALLATSFGSLASGTSVRIATPLPFLELIEVNEISAVLLALTIAALFVLKSLVSIVLNLRTTLFVAEIEARFSKVLAHDFFRVTRSQIAERESVAEFQNRVMFSTYALSTFLNSRISLIAEVTLVLSLVAVFLLVNPIATVALALFMGTVLFLLNSFVSHRLAHHGNEQLAGHEKSLQIIRDLFGVHREVAAANVLGNWISNFFESRKKSARSAALVFTLSGLPRYIIETSLILGIFAFMGGVVLFSDLQSQAMTIGIFMAGGLRLVASLLPMQSAFNQMQDGATRGALAFRGVVAAKDIEERTLPSQRPDLTPSLALHEVTFRYPGSPELVLDSISLQVDPLTKVAIVGPSGAGKSTIFEIAAGFRLADSGLVTIGGLSSSEVLQNSDGYIGIVPQRPSLVTGSLAENVSLRDDPQTNFDKVRNSLIKAGLAKFTQTKSSLNLQIKPDSGQLSGGEIQRLGLARALYRDPKILFLDEATSALDAETEAEITKVLHSLKGEMTVVLIAHRLSTVQYADKIIYVDKGKFVAEGTFSELKARVPDFAKAIQLMDLSRDVERS